MTSDLSRDILDTSLEVDLKTRRARATITIAASPSTAASFEVVDLAVSSVKLDGAPLRFSVGQGLLDVTVPASTEPQVLVFDYAWQPHEQSNGVSAKGYTLTWPYFCSNVFPCHSQPADGTQFHLQLTGTGSGVKAIYPTEIESDAPAYMAAWAVGDYRELSLGETASGTSVSMWHLPGGEADALAGGAHLLEAFEWFEQHLGPYRFGAKVGTVAAPWGDGVHGGMEHHPYWHVAVDSMSNESTQVHEASHGWFGNGVRLRCWEDFVLSEGTATYLAARVLEEVAGTEVSDPIWQGYQGELDKLRANGSSRAWPQSCGEIDLLAGYFTRSPYIRGAYFYRGVEQKVGRAAFDEALAAFYARFAGEAAGMQDMLDVMSEVTGYDPTACAKTWLIDLDVPEPGPCP